MNGHIRTWKLLDYCSWAGKYFLKDWLSTATVLWNILFSICHFEEKNTDWRDFALQVLFSWQTYLENWVKVAVFKIMLFWGIFMNNSKEKVDSEKHNKAPLLPLCKEPRRCQESSFQTQITEPFILSTFFVFCNGSLNNHWVNFKENSDKNPPIPPSLPFFHYTIVDVLQRRLICDGSTSSGRSCWATSYKASTMKDADIIWNVLRSLMIYLNTILKVRAVQKYFSSHLLKLG